MLFRSAVRTGRATPGLVEKLAVDFYGSPQELRQIAGFKVPEPRLLVIDPYDKSSIKAIEKAIQGSDLGVNPSNDGQVIRLAFPQLTEERRRELGKVARHKGEEAKVSIRNVRRHAKDTLDKMARDGETGEDEVRRAEKELDETTQKYVATVDEVVKHKEAELLEV